MANPFENLTEKIKEKPWLGLVLFGAVLFVVYMVMRKGSGTTSNQTQQGATGGLGSLGGIPQPGTTQPGGALPGETSNADYIKTLSDYLNLEQANAKFMQNLSDQETAFQTAQQLQKGQNSIQLTAQQAAEQLNAQSDLFNFYYGKSQVLGTKAGIEAATTKTVSDCPWFNKNCGKTKTITTGNSPTSGGISTDRNPLVMGSRFDILNQAQQTVNATNADAIKQQVQAAQSAQPKQSSCKPILGFGCGSSGFTQFWGGAINNVVTGGIQKITGGLFNNNTGNGQGNTVPVSINIPRFNLPSNTVNVPANYGDYPNLPSLPPMNGLPSLTPNFGIPTYQV
jgi:hypothetical protein